MKLNNQAHRILSLLLSHRGEWIALPSILDLRIGSYTRRIHELRRAGHKIELLNTWSGRERHTAYRIVS